MAVTKLSNSGIATGGVLKYDSMLAGNPPYSPGAFVSLATATPTSGSTITFSGIPQTYKHLQLRMLARESGSGNSYNYLLMRFNGDSGTNYSWTAAYSDGVNGTDVISVGSGSTTYVFPGMYGDDTPTNAYAISICDILDYTNTNKNKTIHSLSGFSQNANTNAYNAVALLGGSWRNTSAITSITITQGTNVAAGSVYALYGIAGS